MNQSKIQSVLTAQSKVGGAIPPKSNLPGPGNPCPCSAVETAAKSSHAAFKAQANHPVRASAGHQTQTTDMQGTPASKFRGHESPNESPAHERAESPAKEAQEMRTGRE